MLLSFGQRCGQLASAPAVNPLTDGQRPDFWRKKCAKIYSHIEFV
jgi:hypothetical protein